ncbi:MAG TPA: hypothetical protein VFH70_08875 [Acidimicrobiales bacterium]|nr:hypothetical protein [Acidimicrobiales bacterium]
MLSAPVAGYAASSDLSAEVPGDAAGWTSTPTTPMIKPGPIAPGQSITGSIELRNQGSTPALLSLRLSQVTGSLAGELRYSVTPAQGPSSEWTGSLSDLEQGIVIDPHLPAGASVSCRITATFPAEAGNQWQGTAASFEEVFTLSQVAVAASRASAAAVGSAQNGEQATVVVPGTAGSPAGGNSAGVLAFTGQRLYSMLAAGAGFILLGSLVSLATRRRAPRRSGYKGD